MSSAAVYETETPAEHIARGINSDFQLIADHLPSEVKHGMPGKRFPLCAIEGIGKLCANYAGQRPDPTGQAIMQYVVQIGVEIDVTDMQVGFTKEFGLTYQTLHAEGPLDDLQPVDSTDLESCPIALDLLEFSIRSLREEFERMHVQTQPHDATIIPFPTDRVA